MEREFEVIFTMPGEEDYYLFDETLASIFPVLGPAEQYRHRLSSNYLIQCLVLLSQNQPIARCAIYFNPNMELESEKVACIGSFESVNNQNVSSFLLNTAIEYCRKNEIKKVIGPMEGSTWNSYRFKTNDENRPYFMEPFHPLYYNDLFREVGFSPLAQYETTIDQTLKYDASLLNKMEAGFKKQGAKLKNLNLEDFENQLTEIANLSNRAFAKNHFFTPISVSDFVEQFNKIKHLINPKLVWLMYDQQDKLQAFGFGIKDYFDPLNETAILKTLAREIDAPFAGVGVFLRQKIIQSAMELGFSKMIYAYMHTDNFSFKKAEELAPTKYRSYALYSKDL
ncbi:MAG: hypothetical protein KDC83_03155 [Flavobacteriales bacterium]|nr:hypothetical protein [Flavobacteriales bacterium]